MCSQQNHERVSTELKQAVENMKATIDKLTEELDELRSQCSREHHRIVFAVTVVDESGLVRVKAK